MADSSSVSVVIPALDEAPSIAELVTALHAAGPWREILVIDDGSSDATATRAESAGALVVRHPYRKGNGAAVKTGIRTAAGEFIVIVDGDGQHAPADACRVIEHLGDYDLVIGARSARTQATTTRRRGNAVLNRLASYLTGRPIPDLTSGLRGARASCLREFLHLLPNGFSTPTTTTLAFIKAGYNVRFVPIDARPRSGRSKIRLARDGATFLLILLKVVTIYSPLRIFVPISLCSAALGVIYGAVNVLAAGRVPNGAVVLLLFAAMVLLAGLVSEQISTMHFGDKHRG